jgi:hypothetical protein
VSVSKAKRLLAESSREKVRLRRHLLVAAALREVFRSEPIVVGGTAEEFWTADEYHETDLDVCAPIGEEELRAFERLRFSREGRHWVRGGVAVEVPESRIDGDVERTRLEPVGEGAARVIGVDDLYIDRLRQATMREHHEGIEFHSALAVAAACYEIIDWPYVRNRIKESEVHVAEPMKRIDAKIRRRVRRELGE